MANSKKNKAYAQRATGVFLTVLGSVASKQGLEALEGKIGLQSNAVQYGINGGVTALGMAGAVMVEDEMIRAFASGVATTGANKVTDQVILGMTAGDMSGMGSVADDFLNQYSNKVDMSGILDDAGKGVAGAKTLEVK